MSNPIGPPHGDPGSPSSAQRAATLVTRRPRLSRADRVLWAWLSRVWIDWREALVIVKPETVIAWHRKGFRLVWTWKARLGRPGRPSVSREVRQLIRQVSRENPLWGAPRIHGELLSWSGGRFNRRNAVESSPSPSLAGSTIGTNAAPPEKTRSGPAEPSTKRVSRQHQPAGDAVTSKSASRPTARRIPNDWRVS
jgi:hypothetical protein